MGGRGGGGTRGRGGDERDGPSRRPGDADRVGFGRDTSRGDARDAMGRRGGGPRESRKGSRGERDRRRHSRRREERCDAQCATRAVSHAVCTSPPRGCRSGEPVSLKCKKGRLRESNSRPPAPKAGIIPLDQDACARYVEPPVANRSTEKRRRAPPERDWRIGTPNVRPVTLSLSDRLPKFATPRPLGGPREKNFLPRYRHLSPAAMVRAPLGRGRADECSVRTAPAPVRARGRRSLSRVRASSGTAGIRGQICGSRGWRNPSTRGVVRRSGLSRCDGDLCPADGVRGARGDGSVLGNPPRLQLAACLVSRPRFRSRRPRRRASTSRLSAQCKVARGARAT